VINFDYVAGTTEGVEGARVRAREGAHDIIGNEEGKYLSPSRKLTRSKDRAAAT